MVPFLCAEAAPVEWTGGSGNWNESAKWDGEEVPGDGDAVVIPAGASVALTNATAQLAGLTLHGTLTFSKWTTALNATNVVVKAGGIMTHTLCDTNAATDNLNRVWIVCSNLTVEAAGAINADAVGYKGGVEKTVIGGQGPGGGINGAQSGAGGSYGGEGGLANVTTVTYARPPYGSAEEPTEPGSGGGCKVSAHPGNGGNGGGAVRIQAEGTVAVYGTITANGGKGGQDRGAGGSGGGIYITCRNFSGNGGGVAANGGDAWNTSGGGGGGRIALHYTNAIASGVDVRFTAGRGLSPHVTSGVDGDIGTIWFSDDSFLDPTRIRHIGQLISPAIATSWSVPALTVSNGWIRFTQSNLQLTVTNDITVTGAQGVLQLSKGATLHGGADLIVTNGGSLHVYAAATNASSPNYSSLIEIEGGLFVRSGSWIYPVSEPINGATPRFVVGSLLVEANAGFNADKKGYAGKGRSTGYGPGAGIRGYGLSEASGGGHGGAGGNGRNVSTDGSIIAGGSAYGSLYAPTSSGSAGGSEVDNPTNGDRHSIGGGSIRIDVLGDAILNGVLTADAGETVYGGGAGGGIFVRCTGTFSGGEEAVLSASGGNSTYTTATSGGGGGGRIAVWWNTPSNTWSRLEQGILHHEAVSTSHAVYGGATDVSGGTGAYDNGEPGTLVFLTLPPPAETVIVIR